MDDKQWDDKQRFLDCLRTFVQIDGMESAKQAAAQLEMSRTTISGRINDLEEMLGCDLTSKGITKTKTGEAVTPEAARLLSELEAGFDAARTQLKRIARPRSPVQVAMSPTIWMWGAERELLPLTHTLPRRNAVEFLVANSERVERTVADGWFELGITARHPTESIHRKLTCAPFRSDEIVLAVPPEHDWSGADEVIADELKATPLIMLDTSANARLIVDYAMQGCEFELAEPFEEVAMAVMAFEEALSSGVPALVPKLAFESPQGRLAVERGIAQSRVSGLDLSREFLVVHDRNLRPEAAAVRDVLVGLSDG